MDSQPTPRFAVFDDYRPTVTIVVAVRWLLLLATFFRLHYRVERDAIWLTDNLLAAGIVVLNAYLTWRIMTRRRITWQHGLIPSLVDLTAITAGLFLNLGLQNNYFIFYYPALLGLSLVFPGRTSFAVVGVVIALYIVMAFTVSPTLDMDLMEEKALIERLVTMVGMVVAGTLINGWERARRREAVAAERRRAEENLELQRKAQQAELAAVKERSRIAREIHDGIAQSIYMMNISLEACTELASRGQDGLQERLQSLVKISKQALLDTRYYIFDLKPLLDGSRSVTEMMEHQVQEFRTVTAIPTTFSVSGTEAPLALATSAGLYRIVQEGLANVYKHAQASQVEVRLGFDEGQVQLEINDNGQGFTTAGGERSGYGLGNMVERARELGGRLDIDSVPERGTRLLLSLPAGVNPTEPSPLVPD